MSNPATIARRMSSQLWGEVNSQLKVAEGIWLYSNSGHGGFIVDTNVYPELRGYESVVYIRNNSSYYRPSEQHFAPFEEDCEFAKIIWLYPKVLKKMSKLYTLGDRTYKEWESDMLRLAKESLEQWNKEFLSANPTHGEYRKGC